MFNWIKSWIADIKTAFADKKKARVKFENELAQIEEDYYRRIQRCNSLREEIYKAIDTTFKRRLPYSGEEDEGTQKKRRFNIDKRISMPSRSLGQPLTR